MAVFYPALCACFIFTALLASTADGLKCVQCADCASNIPAASECHTGEKHCMKTVVEGGKVSRACVHAKTEGCIQKTCTYSCDTDGCNGAATTHANLMVAAAVAAIVTLLGFKST